VHRVVLAQAVLRRELPEPLGPEPHRPGLRAQPPQLGGLPRGARRDPAEQLAGVGGFERGEQEHPQHQLVAHLALPGRREQPRPQLVAARVGDGVRAAAPRALVRHLDQAVLGQPGQLG
jgi:hypothetical protein